MTRGLFFLLFFLPLGLKAQFALEDAIRLREYLIPLNNEATVAKFVEQQAFIDHCLPILLQYVDDPSLIEEDSDLKDAFFGNPFIGTAQGTSRILLPNTFQAEVEVAKLVDDIGVPSPAPGGLFVTNLADGIARFLAERSRQELTLAFFRRFQEALTERPEFAGLFPATSGLLLVIDQQIYQYRAYLEGLREAFIRDLRTLPTNLHDYLVLHPEALGLNEVQQLIAEDALQVSQQLVDGASPIEILEYFGEEAELQDRSRWQGLPDATKNQLAETAGILHMVDLFAQSLRTDTADQTWLSPRTTARALNDPKVLFLYLGLLWQQAERVSFGATTLRQQLQPLARGTEHLARVQNNLRAFSRYGEQMSSSLDSLQQQVVAEAGKYEHFYRYFSGFSGLLNEGLDMYTQFAPDTSAGVQLARQLLVSVRAANDINYSVRRRQYVTAVTSLVDLLTAVAGDRLDKDLRTELLHYGTFIATVGEARSSQEVSAALQLFALPPGSSGMKKYNRFTVAVNAYTGLSYGQERLDRYGSKPVMAVSAPVGLGFNWGMNDAGSIGLYTPLIDVGALTAFRINDKRTADLPALRWENILAPGLQAVYGTGKNLPLAIGFGVQRGPNLREVTPNATFVFEEATGWRWLLFATVDIPVIHLYNR